VKLDQIFNLLGGQGRKDLVVECGNTWGQHHLLLPYPPSQETVKTCIDGIVFSNTMLGALAISTELFFSHGKKIYATPIACKANIYPT
jgi:hypothetical protein